MGESQRREARERGAQFGGGEREWKENIKKKWSEIDFFMWVENYSRELVVESL